ncbi:hypothetical protein CN266_04580 [Bacillus cereus]|nr:hypothetical protein CN266_04580 [Bacillus cereus]PFJ19582.1 hypothetical protein COI91_18425 [Bacillus cereus]PGX46190.1 hypothetical protein COE37_23075 [Bacillus cereus]
MIVKIKKNKESYYIHVYTLRDKTTKSTKIESRGSLKEEMQVLGIMNSCRVTIMLFKNGY